MQLVPPIKKKYSGFRLFLMTVLGRAYPRMIGMQRDVTWLLFDVLMPVGVVITYVLVYKAIHAPEDYIGFVVFGGAMTAYWMNVLWAMASQLYWEKEQGNLALYILSPANMMAILLGMALGGLVATTIRAFIVILAGSLLFQVHYAISSFWQLILVFFLSMTALYGMGIYF
jgi:ABC-2 type transport system permease protein